MPRDNRIPRRGAVLVYALFMMMMMCAMTSLAVDYGRVQLTKTQLQRCADATARGALELYVDNNKSLSTAKFYAPGIANYNPVDAGSGISPTVTITWGYWNTANNTFITGSAGSHPLAVKVVASRSTQNGNPVPLVFPIPSSAAYVKTTCDVWAQAIAILPKPISLTQNVMGYYDPWLAGMPAGSTASYDDTAGTVGTTAITSGTAVSCSPAPITVIPGSTITITSTVTGTSSHDFTDPTTDPTGDTGNIYWHMKDPPAGAVPAGQGAQNHIGDVIAPIDSLLGVFLTSSAPTSHAAPTSVRTYSTDMGKNQLNDIQVQQPFYIGDGTNNSGNGQVYVVPAGATRFYMGQMDGYEWNNNPGYYSATFTEQPPIQLVQ